MVPKGICWADRDQLNVHRWKGSAALHWSITTTVPLSRKHWPLLGFLSRLPWNQEKSV